MNEDVKGLLDDHENRIRNLEIDTARQNEILSNLQKGQEKLEYSMIKLENTVMTNNNTVLSKLDSLLLERENNISKEKIAFGDNLTKIIIQILILSGTIISSIWVGSKVVN